MTSGPPCRPDSFANHQSLVPSPIPKCYLLLNYSYMNKQLAGPSTVASPTDPPPSRSDSRECHQSLVPNPLPKCYGLINDAYMNNHLFNPTKGTPLEGPQTQIINPSPDPDIKSSPVGVVHDFGVLDVLNVVG